MILKTTYHIFNNPWEEKKTDLISPPPPTLKWNKDGFPTVNDIDLWEELYYQKGNVGIYGAYNPHAELYIIVYNLFIKEPCGIEVYSGPEAAVEVWKKASELSIKLPLTHTKIEE